jgi:hypothetical protein
MYRMTSQHASVSIGSGAAGAEAGEEREEGGGQEAADHDDGEGALDLGAVEIEEEGWQEAEDGGRGGHDLGADAADAGFAEGGGERDAFADQGAGLGDEDEAVPDGDAEEADEADERGDAPGLAGEPEGEDAADEGVGEGGEDDQGLGDGAEGEVEEEEDGEEGDGDGDQEGALARAWLSTLPPTSRK